MKNEKVYEAPTLDVLPLAAEDILTASNPNTDLGPDIGEWDSDM